MSRLRVHDLTRQFGGLTAVDRVTFEVPSEGVTAVIGPNGAGKTTLFSMISGFLEPTGGRVFFEGEEITAIAPERIAARGLIRTFQLVQLFQNLTTLENVKIGRHLRTEPDCSRPLRGRLPRGARRRRSRPVPASCLLS